MQQNRPDPQEGGGAQPGLPWVTKLIYMCVCVYKIYGKAGRPGKTTWTPIFSLGNSGPSGKIFQDGVSFGVNLGSWVTVTVRVRVKIRN